MISHIFLILLFYIPCIVCIPVNNGVVGEPEIECGTDAITAVFNTQNPFEGHVYVKGHYDDYGCKTDATNKNDAKISVNFGECNMLRQKSINPPGLYVSITVIITFHPKFITKVDRAYDIKCFYMEADKTVSTQVEVSGLTTQSKQETVPMPTCRYEVLRGGQFGKSVRYATIGETVWHQWVCDTETVDTFCMRVHSCYVDDGQGSKVNLLDDKGCALDQFLLQNLVYTKDLTAGQESHVFKYADRPSLFFQCQIAVYLKDKGTCERPFCNTKPIPKGRHRREIEPEFELDVSTPQVSVLDLDDSISDLPQTVNLNYPNFEVAKNLKESICFATSTLLGAGAAMIFVVLCTIFTVLVIYHRRTGTVLSPGGHDTIVNGYSLKK